MTNQQFRKRIRRTMARLESLYDADVDPVKAQFAYADAATKIGHCAAMLGHVDLYKRSLGLTPDWLAVKQFLAECLASLPDNALLSVPQVAQRYKVSPSKVRGWIKSGLLTATNTGKRRARYRITPDALAEFDARGVSGAIPKRRKLQTIVKRY